MGLAEELEGQFVLRHLAHSAVALFGLFLREMVLMNFQELQILVGGDLLWETTSFLSQPAAGQAALELSGPDRRGDALLVLCRHDLCLSELSELLWRHSGMDSELARLRLPACLWVGSGESFLGRD